MTSRDDAFAFVDAHHHLWDLTRLNYAWLSGEPYAGHPSGDYSAIIKNHLVTDLMREGEAVNLIKSVHIETADGETDPVQETAWLQEVADLHGMPNGIIARVDLQAPDVEATLERHQSHVNFRGVRMLSFMGRDFLDDPAFRRGFDALQKRDLIYDMDAGEPQMGQARDLAESFPRATIILGHCGFPKQRTAAYFHAWRKGILHLAGAHNVACKLSGLLMVDHHWTTESLRPWIETCIEAFGPERCMFGTNWPLDGLHGGYAAIVAAYRTIVRGYSTNEQRRLFRTTAEGWYRI